MADTRATITGGVGAILAIAVVVGAITHSLDRYNWEQQHKTDGLGSPGGTGRKGLRFSNCVYKSLHRRRLSQSASITRATGSKVRDSLIKVLMTRMQEFEVQLPIAAAKVKLYFSDSTYKTFDRTRFLMSQGLLQGM